MVDSCEVGRRVARVHGLMDEFGVSSLFVCSPRNVLYLSGREVGRVLLTSRGDFLWTRDLYQKVYGGLYGGRGYPFEVGLFEKGVVKDMVKRLSLKKLFVEDLEHTNFVRLRGDLGVKLGTTDVLDFARSIKTPLEIDLIRKSCSIAVKGMRRAREVVRSGVSEQLALSEVEYVIRKNGSDSPPFEDGMLLSSGKDSADVHARAKNKKMRSGTSAVVDLGARYQGYYSDMTRTFGIGRVDKEKKDLLSFVDNLRAEAIDMLRPGLVAGDVHSFIEKKIESRGYKFYHGSGHGVGLNIHEFPSISKDSKDVLQKDMVFTIEPGIYIPDKFGVRFEDTVLLKKNGAEILTKY